jgi:hypothetical protein
VYAHELATLNETREENIALKASCENLRKRNEGLLERNVVLKDTVNGTTLALDGYMKAVRLIGGKKLLDAVTAAAKEIIGVPAKDTKPNKRNRPLQVAATQ